MRRPATLIVMAGLAAASALSYWLMNDTSLDPGVKWRLMLLHLASAWTGTVLSLVEIRRQPLAALLCGAINGYFVYLQNLS